MNSSEKRVLAVLHENPDGLTFPGLVRRLGGRTPRIVERALRSVYGVYIDRWVLDEVLGEYIPVYCIVEVPEHSPRPSRKLTEEERGVAR